MFYLAKINCISVEYDFFCLQFFLHQLRYAEHNASAINVLIGCRRVEREKHQITDFVKVAESGTAIDGRFIDPRWLIEAAEHYSKKLYTAIITLEHYDPEWSGNLGTVEELESRDEGDRKVGLWAKLAPNKLLIELNRAGQKLFASILVDTDFAKRGHAYVYQIGVTDKPASMGTSQLAFNTGTVFYSPEIEVPQHALCAGTRNVIAGLPAPADQQHSTGSVFKRMRACFPAFTSRANEHMTRDELHAAVRDELQAAVRDLSLIHI